MDGNQLGGGLSGGSAPSCLDRLKAEALTKRRKQRDDVVSGRVPASCRETEGWSNGTERVFCSSD